MHIRHITKWRSIWDLHYQGCFTPMHTPMHIYVTSRGRGPYGIYTQGPQRLEDSVNQIQTETETNLNV